MRTLCNWVCEACGKFEEVERDEKTLEVPPNKGKCLICKGDLIRGLHKRIFKKEKSK